MRGCRGAPKSWVSVSMFWEELSIPAGRLSTAECLPRVGPRSTEGTGRRTLPGLPCCAATGRGWSEALALLGPQQTGGRSGDSEPL